MVDRVDCGLKTCLLKLLTNLPTSLRDQTTKAVEYKRKINHKLQRRNNVNVLLLYRKRTPCCWQKREKFHGLSRPCVWGRDRMPMRKVFFNMVPEIWIKLNQISHTCEAWPSRVKSNTAREAARGPPCSDFSGVTRSSFIRTSLSWRTRPSIFILQKTFSQIDFNLYNSSWKNYKV